jgi:hypothetical protein
MCRYGNFETQSELKVAAQKLSEFFSADGFVDIDEILIDILLFRASKTAAKRRVEALKSQKIIEEISRDFRLGEDYRELLIDYYGHISCAVLFTDALGARRDSFDVDALRKKVGGLLKEAKKNETRLGRVKRDNEEYIAEIAKENTFSRGLLYDLFSQYARRGAVNFEENYESALMRLNAARGKVSLNKVLAAKVALCVITEAEATKISALGTAVKYPVEPCDLQTIAFKYLPLKTAQDVVETLEALLKRLPHARSPLENLGAAVKIMTEADAETFRDAKEEARKRQDKTLYMRKLARHKPFCGYEEEILSLFYPKRSAEEVMAFFGCVLNELPYDDAPEENADIAVKILLRKLPAEDGLKQAYFRKEHKDSSAVDALESEALNSYLGVKPKEEIISFFREELSGYTFWKDAPDKRGCALAILADELNGKITRAGAELALQFLQAGYPEESADFISKSIHSAPAPAIKEIIDNYERFYSKSADHKDAVMRLVNMLQ